MAAVGVVSSEDAALVGVVDRDWDWGGVWAVASGVSAVVMRRRARSVGTCMHGQNKCMEDMHGC